MFRDFVRLNDIVLFAHLGVSEAEREMGQRIHIDVELTVDLSPVEEADALADTINYEAVYTAVESDTAQEVLVHFFSDGVQAQADALVASLGLDYEDAQVRQVKADGFAALRAPCLTSRF